MKAILFFFLLGLLAIPAGTTISGSACLAPTTITLNASQVISAIDIENAIHQATAEGKRPGVVILDGSQGPFVFDHPDRAINIFVSNLTLRGKNNAYFPNTDGIYLDDGPYDNLVIEDLAMICSNDCVGGVGVHNRVTIRRNLFSTGGMGIGVRLGSNWNITGNTIRARVYAIHLIQTGRALVTNNHLSGEIGILLEGAGDAQVYNNAIAATWQGILLNGEAFRNQVRDNSILNVNAAGIALEPGVSRNRIAANRVACALAQPCLTIDASPETLAANTLTGNRP